ncbi:DNA-processing protein DprA [Vallitalea okinawensis]|uniref:DNA-processing protein DprA n=1 Tax=Vallitalea okinawensis TaxID=2078660 RepID=UPI000CFC1E94|nr:DNA-processing protein DprA [Vallitalea okinawensis]
MRRDLIWLWLNKTPNIGYKKIKKLQAHFGDLEDIWNANREGFSHVKELLPRDINLLFENKNLDDLLAYEEKLQNLGIQYITFDHQKYPDSLLNIYDPPQVIYVKGEIPVDSLKVGIVGARRCSQYGKYVAYKISKELVEKSVTVVSGMARGIDTAAHNGAIEGGGKTIAVLGCGLDICYPKENNKLMASITEHGAVISEFPLGTPPLAKNFPRRNRIISGLSRALIVAEAALKSGSLITADHALEQGLDVYAIPGSILSKTSEGANWLIKQGAKVLTSSEDILLDFNLNYPKINENYQTKLKIELAKDEKMIYDNLGLEPLHIDVLCAKTNMSITQIQHIVTILELDGYIEQLPGKRFIKKM